MRNSRSRCGTKIRHPDKNGVFTMKKLSYKKCRNKKNCLWQLFLRVEMSILFSAAESFFPWAGFCFRIRFFNNNFTVVEFAFV